MSVGASSAKRPRAPPLRPPQLAVLRVSGPGIAPMSLAQHSALAGLARAKLARVVSAVIDDAAGVGAALGALLRTGAGALVVVVGEGVPACALAAAAGVRASELRALAASGALRVARTPWLSRCLRDEALHDVSPAELVDCGGAAPAPPAAAAPPAAGPAAGPAAAAAPRLVRTRVPGLALLLDCISPAVEQALFESALFAGSLPAAGEARPAWLARMEGLNRVSRGQAGSLRRRVYGEELPPARWPPELLRIFSAAVRAGVAGDLVAVCPDSVHPLLYPPEANMPPHCDSWLAWGGYIFGISLGASAVLQMTTDGDDEVRVTLPRASAYVMAGAARRSLRPLPASGGLPADAWRHAITKINAEGAAPPAWNALGLRASITLRCTRSTEAAALLELQRQAGGGGLARPPPPEQMTSQLAQSACDGPQRDEFWVSTGGSVMKWDRVISDEADRGGRLSTVPAALRERLSAGAAQPLAWWRDAGGC